MKKKFLVGLAVGFLMFGMVGMAGAATIISNANLGDHTTDAVTFNLSGLAAHTEITINFDLYILDSWDGPSGPFPHGDYFGFSVDGAGLGWSFNNFINTNDSSYILETSKGNFNSINDWGEIDRYFENYRGGFTLSHSLSTLALSFYGYGAGFQGINDESWRVTNLVVTANTDNPVPEPSTILLLGFGLVGLVGVARNKMKK